MVRFILLFVLLIAGLLYVVGEKISDRRLPEDLAQIVTVHPEGAVVAVRSGSKGSQATMALNEAPELAVTWHYNDLIDKGWAYEGETEVLGRLSLEFSREGRTLFVETWRGRDGETLVHVRLVKGE